MKRFHGWGTVCAVALVAVVLLATPVAAAEEGPVTWVILDQVQPGKTGAYVKLVTENFGPTLDRMMAAGQVLSWGMAQRETGTMEYDHAGWVTYPSWDAVAASEAEMGKMMGERGPEGMAKIGEDFAATLEPHRSMIRYLRGKVFEVAPEAPPAGYLMVSDWHAGLGKEGDLEALYGEVKPALAQVMAAGGITGYGMYAQELHDGGSSHLTWYTMADLSAIPKVDAAIDAAVTPEMRGKMASIVDMAAHRDTLWRIIHLGGGGGGGE